MYNILTYLEMSALKYPNKYAFIDENKKISYSELVSASKRLGTCILYKYGKTKNPIIFFVDRTIESIIIMLGILYSGNFYIPIDKKIAQNRLSYIIENLNCELMIVKRNDAVIDEICLDCNKISLIDALKSNIGDKELKKVRDLLIDIDIVYAMFTSGSTGNPKAVLINHRSIIDLVERFTEVFHFSEELILGNQAPFDFDVSVKDIYSVLKNSGTMCIIPQNYFVFPIKLMEFLNKNKVNTLIWATSVLRIIMNFDSLKTTKPDYIKKIMFSGETMPVKVLNYWINYISDATYVNLYGPTEITCNCTYYIVDRKFSDCDTLPIGKSFPNTDILLLNGNEEVKKRDEIGEICVRGSSLSLGYFNSSDATSKAFCQNPLNTSYPEIIYRTGDLAKRNSNDELIFMGRKDYQIKHMGHRIELGEIETVVNSLDYVNICACLYNKEKEKITLIYQSRNQCDKNIIQDLYKKLPKYMCPTVLIHCENMILNKRGKIDRVALKKYINN